MAAISKTKMAAKMLTYQLASIKIPVERYPNYLCAKIHNFIQKCTPYYLRDPTISSEAAFIDPSVSPEFPGHAAGGLPDSIISSKAVFIDPSVSHLTVL